MPLSSLYRFTAGSPIWTSVFFFFLDIERSPLGPEHESTVVYKIDSRVKNPESP